MINNAQLSLIKSVMDMLEQTDTLQDEAEMNIDVKLVSHNTYVEIFFEHEHGEWTFRVEVE